MTFYVSPSGSINTSAPPLFASERPSTPQLETIKKTAFLALKIIAPIACLVAAPFPISIGLALGSFILANIIERINCCCCRCGVASAGTQRETAYDYNPLLIPEPRRDHTYSSPDYRQTTRQQPHVAVGSRTSTAQSFNSSKWANLGNGLFMDISDSRYPVDDAAEMSRIANPAPGRNIPISHALSGSTTLGRDDGQPHVAVGSRNHQQTTILPPPALIRTPILGPQIRAPISSTLRETTVSGVDRSLHTAVGTRSQTRLPIDTDTVLSGATVQRGSVAVSINPPAEDTTVGRGSSEQHVVVGARRSRHSTTEN